jgi:hypothetical protein
MRLNSYSNLINSLPVKEQSFETKRRTWLNAEERVGWLRDYNNSLFNTHDSIIISREDIFRTSEIRDTIIKTIYWGYPRGMRGNHFILIMNQIDSLERTLDSLVGINTLTKTDFIDLTEVLGRINGLGLSTYTKLLYFLMIKFENQACLILDQRLIDLFASRKFVEFESLKHIRYTNAQYNYLDYLTIMHASAVELNVSGENIEQFLFLFGKNLKTYV